VGRAAAIDALREETLDSRPSDPPSPLSEEVRALIDDTNASGELRRLLEHRVPELVAYQDLAYARSYLGFVRWVHERERKLGPLATGRLAEAVARQLFRLMAYKDEYEVARLNLSPAFRETIEREFGTGAAIHYHLHPPLLRALGLHRKIRLGRWFDPIFRGLHRLRRLRGTALDLFGYHPVRKLERALIREYREMMETEVKSLTADRYPQAVALAETADLIRGYEDIKLANVVRYRAAVAELQAGGARSGAASSEPAAPAVAGITLRT
jgi:indolepyruvate ferredoxin oxidoreductase